MATLSTKNQEMSTEELKVLTKCLQISSSDLLSNSELQNEEAIACHNFTRKYYSERQFSDKAQSSDFKYVLSKIVSYRLVDKTWRESVPLYLLYRNVICLRVLLRDKILLNEFIDYQAMPQLILIFNRVANLYFKNPDSAHILDLLRALSSIFQKLSCISTQLEVITDCDAHKNFVLLLTCSDVTLIHCCLLVLINLSQNQKSRILISELDCVEHLLMILQDYDNDSRRHAANLLRLLLPEKHTKELLNIYNGVPVLLSLLQCEDHTLLWHVLWCLVQLAEDTHGSTTICNLGGIPLLLSILSNKFSNESTSKEENGSIPPKQENEDKIESLNIKSACCAALTELIQTDTNAQKVIVNNGLYLLTVLVLTEKIPHSSKKYLAAFERLQCNIFRVLRFLFSMERNRRLFRKLFPASLYEVFIDVGHYNRELSAYKPVVQKLQSLNKIEEEELRENILSSNINKEACQNIREYEVLELLGSGAFGSVYKARKKDAGPNTYFAIKEVNTLQAALGRTAKERDKSVGQIISELTIIKDKLRHPNCVRYYRTFVDNDRLYIVMEMIEGASLAEYFVSLREKGNYFPIERVWIIFIQLVLVLRYLHKEKAIVHRDLSPNNIMLGEHDRITVTDFGLAKRKRQDTSQMNSIVGTILYACPEIVQHHPYTEKADIWSLGCVLYQMCTLSPPFNSSNMLSLATKIVDGDYDPIEPNYGPKIDTVVASCLTPDPEKRPDILGVAGLITEEILIHLDHIRNQQINAEKKLERERRRNVRYFGEHLRHKCSYQCVQSANQNNSSASCDQKPCVDMQTSRLTGSIYKQDIDSHEAPGSSRPNSGSVCSPSSPSSIDYGYLDSAIKELKCENADDYNVSFPTNTSSNTICSSTSNQINQGSNSNSRQDSPATFVQSPVVQIRAQHLSRFNTRYRPDNGSALTIAQHRLRPVNDPILRLLSLVHKIVCISQLPPTLTVNPKRKLVEKLKRSLFSSQLTAVELKKQLLRFLEGSRELIDLDLGEIGLLTSQIYSQISQDAENNDFDVSPKNDCLTYEQMFGIIENVLEEIGYYDYK